MPTSNANSERSRAAKRKLREALSVLKTLGLPREQQNDRSALTLLALLDLKPGARWSDASAPLLGITPMITFFAQNYGTEYAPNTRETVRKQTVQQFVQAGLVVENPDSPSRPTNSPRWVYQIEPSALAVLRTFGTADWKTHLKEYLRSVGSLKARYARERKMKRIPLSLGAGKTISLSPGRHNLLIEKTISDFCPRFTPRAKLAYVGDTEEKWAYFDRDLLASLGIVVETHGKMPDVVIYDETRRWLVLVEAVTSHGPVNPKRRAELQELFRSATPALVFVTAFLDRRGVSKYLSDISWETDVWVADAPTHMIHFDGERFLGPYDA